MNGEWLIEIILLCWTGFATPSVTIEICNQPIFLVSGSHAPALIVIHKSKPSDLALGVQTFRFGPWSPNLQIWPLESKPSDLALESKPSDLASKPKSEGFSGSHAPAWEPIWFAPASRFCGLACLPRRWHVENAFPRRRVGTRKYTFISIS